VEYNDPAFVDEDEEPNPCLNEITNRIIGCLIAVHRELGPGYLEAYYERALEIEFKKRGVQFSRQHPFAVTYQGVVIGEGRLDFLIEETVILELKATESISPTHVATMISYLRANKKKLGIIANLNVKYMKDGLKRIAN
jgi:GxxExxY protein